MVPYLGTQRVKQNPIAKTSPTVCLSVTGLYLLIRDSKTDGRNLRVRIISYFLIAILTLWFVYLENQETYSIPT